MNILCIVNNDQTLNKICDTLIQIKHKQYLIEVYWFLASDEDRSIDKIKIGKDDYLKTYELTKINTNDLLKNIAHIVNSKSIDLVILDESIPKFNSWLSEKIKSESFLKQFNCPVLLLTENARFSSIENVGVLISDFNHKSYSHLEHIKKLVSGTSIKIHLFSVIETFGNNYFVIEFLDEISQKYQLQKHSINTVFNENIVEGVSSFIRKKNLDLVVATIGENPFSVSRNIVKASDKLRCSVLVS